MGQLIGSNYVPTQQLVVLRNGEVLTGQITETDTNTIVETVQGSRLVLDNDRVDFVCDSIQDAYWGKCARTKASDVAGQKSLFYWCLKHGMHAQAQNQILLIVESKKAKASEIEFLDRQLSVSIDQLQKRNKAKALAQQSLPPKSLGQDRVAQPSSATGEVNAVFPSRRQQSLDISIDSSLGTGQLAGNEIDYNTFRPLPPLNALAGNASPSPEMTDSTWVSPVEASSSGQHMIRQVGFEGEIESDQLIQKHKTNSLNHELPNPVKPQPASTELVAPTVAELDRMTRSMPKGTLGPYRSKLERVLINGCSAAKCHDSRSEVMPLMDLGRSKPIPRRMSQRNLHETLKFVDRSNPFASPLLLAASQPHAGVDKPVLPSGSKHFEQLKLWVIMLSDDPDENYQAYLNPSLQEKLAVEPIEEDYTSQEEIVPVEPERIGLQPLDPISEHSQTIGEIPKLDNQADTYQPVDPFDPEVFNRRFGEQ